MSNYALLNKTVLNSAKSQTFFCHIFHIKNYFFQSLLQQDLRQEGFHFLNLQILLFVCTPMQ